MPFTVTQASRPFTSAIRPAGGVVAASSSVVKRRVRIVEAVPEANPPSHRLSSHCGGHLPARVLMILWPGSHSARDRRVRVCLEESASDESALEPLGAASSERQRGGTVREDYSPHGTAWEYCTTTRDRAPTGGTKGIAGIWRSAPDRICFALALWNRTRSDPEGADVRLTGNEATTARTSGTFSISTTRRRTRTCGTLQSIRSGLSDANLVAEKRGARKRRPQYELLDTGVFDESRCLTWTVEHAKLDADVTFRADPRRQPRTGGGSGCPARKLRHSGLRNTWSWGR